MNRIAINREGPTNNPITNALSLKKINKVTKSQDFTKEKNFIKYLENLQLKSYKDKLFQKNDSVCIFKIFLILI